ncbi:hypothetical protein SAMN06298216_0821 [Spirosomataceae bacterium TFI 002]|nr:hypothetical protein SAMN06298216_0821 [Spirosomataceae bacterium TFI 002]
MKVTLLIFFSLLSLSSIISINDSPVFKVNTPNEGSFQVYESKNSNGELIGYHSQIKAPVCESGVCYDVNVTFHWNLIGSFSHFETKEKDPLTKLDHVPFTAKDYQKLQSILTNHDLIFTGMPAEKLVSKTKKNELDAVSGATVATIKDEVIEGALFTCYTLWHIANGAVEDSIEIHTKKQLQKPTVNRIANLNNDKAYYYLIENLNENQIHENLTLLLSLVSKSKGYFPKNAFESFPLSLYETDELKTFIKNEYPNFSYHTRNAVLEKLHLLKQVDSTLLQILISQLGERNSSENVKITELILKNGDQQIWRDLATRKNIYLSEAHRSQLKALLIK